MKKYRIFYSSEEIRQSMGVEDGESFEKIWNIQSPWFEPINQRRNGWSGVITWPEKKVKWFIKRQENHNTRTLRHPFCGVPTFRKEFYNLSAFDQAKIPSLHPDYYAERKSGKRHQAIIITRALTGYENLYTWYETYREDDTKILSIFKQLAVLIRHMHDCGFIHGCLYPNHILLENGVANKPDIRLIDLEKTKLCRIFISRRIKDLERFIRHTHNRFSRQHIEYFLSSYLEKPLNSRERIKKALLS